MQRTMGWIRLYSNGVAIRVMLEYIDYWGDQRVGDDGMTPVSSNREKDEGSKQLILVSHCYPSFLLDTLSHPSRFFRRVHRSWSAIYLSSSTLPQDTRIRLKVVQCNGFRSDITGFPSCNG